MFVIQVSVAQADIRDGSGTNLTIEAAGTVLEDIEEGAYVILQVKYGLIRLINTQADFCEQIKTVDLDCPLKKGHQKIIKDVAIPKEVPPVCLVILSYVSSSGGTTCGGDVA